MINAPTKWRFLSALIDCLIVAIPAFLLSFILLKVTGAGAEFKEFWRSLDGLVREKYLEVWNLKNKAVLHVYLCIGGGISIPWIGYFGIYGHYSKYQTLGRYLFHLELVNANNQRKLLSDVLIREISTLFFGFLCFPFISIIFFMQEIIMMSFTRLQYTIPDYLSVTRLIVKKDYALEHPEMFNQRVKPRKESREDW